MAVVARRVYGWPIELHFLRDLSNVCHRLLWWWCRQWINPFMPLCLWCTLLRGLPFQDGLLNVVYTPVGVRIYVVSLDNLCPKICPGVDISHWQSYILMVQVWCQRVTAGRENLARILLLLIGGNLMTQKSESHMNAVCTACSNCGSLQNPSYDTSPILSSIKTSHAPNQSKELEPFAPSPFLLMVPMQWNWKCALVMLWSMLISNVAPQFWLAS